VTSRDRIVLVVVLAVAALGAFWMLALRPKRQEAAKLGHDLSAAQQKLDQARSDLQSGQAAKASYAANYSAVARLGKAVPSDDDVPSLVYQLDSTANSVGVDFRSVKVTSGGGTPTGSVSAAKAAAATSDKNSGGANGQQSGSTSQGPANQSPGSGSQSSSGSQPSGSSSSSSSSGNALTSSSSSPAPATQSATATLPPGAVVGQAGLSTMPFSFRFTGSFFRLSDFLSHLESYITPRNGAIDVSGRLLLINGIALNAADSGFPRMEASISATAYLVPPEQGMFNGATPQGPAGSGGSQSAGSSGSSPSPTPAATVKP
jgi:Tfp pilus assembly protein PilO